MIDNSLQRKPKLIFFQYKYGESLPPFLLMHKQEHVKCLSHFFDVQVIAEDCDYSEICDKYEPDLALFESGVPLPSCRRLNITGVRGSDEVPKLGFLHADGFCCGRAGFISDMDHWGIETFFAIASTAAEHTYQFQERLFIWPNFIDEDLYDDYGQYKSIPVLFTGNKSSMYPWRHAILQRVAKRYPSLICPHSGYAPGASSARMVVGESYARMLNAAWFVPACGGVAKELVRKHLEIPACKACLIAERSPILEAAGFVDMVNCVFADADTVVDKIDALFSDEARLLAIIAAGHKLAHTRHTMKHRDQVFQWYTLHKQLKPGQRIIQPGPFAPMLLVERESHVTNGHLAANGYHLSLLRDGDKHMLAGDMEEAEHAYLKCLTFISYMPEPQLKLAICSLLRGKPNQALAWINKPLHFTLVDYAAKDPDPLEWAYYLITLLCAGKARRAAEEATQFPWLQQRELSWTRWIVQACVGKEWTRPSVAETRCARISIHQLPERSFEQWVEHVQRMMVACGQREMSEKVRLAYARVSAPPKAPSTPPNSTTTFVERSPQLQRTLSFLKKHQASQVRKQRVKQTLRRLLYTLESRFGYFLPLRMSSARNDELIETIQQVMRDEQPRKVMAIGTCARGVIGEAVAAVARESKVGPSLLFVGPSTRRLARGYDKLTLHQTDLENGRGSNKDVLRALKDSAQDKAFDLVILDGAAISSGRTLSEALLDAMQQARVVFLINLQNPEIHMAYRAMLENSNFTQVQQNPISWQGYAYFERQNQRRQIPLQIEIPDPARTIAHLGGN